MNAKTGFQTLTLWGVWWLLAVPAHAAFNSGSTGADGAFAPASNVTLPVPPSGVFNYTTITIPAGVTVTFTPNAANTPVTMLASGDVVINGTINVSGQAGNSATQGGLGGANGPGGFRGGHGSNTVGISGGSGFGPGGGTGGTSNTGGAKVSGGGGSFGTVGYGLRAGPTYGTTALLPLIGGSGGGGGSTSGDGSNGPGGGGGGGGGAIVIASSGSITVGATGSVVADGGLAGAAYNVVNGGAAGGGGSGGAIRLIANTITNNTSPSVIVGIFARAANAGTLNAGGAGRIRLDAVDVSAGNTNPVATSGAPTVVALSNANAPTLLITSVAGQAAPPVPIGGSGGIDLSLPTQTGPATIAVAATNIPTGTTVTVSVLPENGSVITGTGTLSGTSASSTTSVDISLPSGVSFITASATFSAPLSASLGSPLLIAGEPVEKIRVSARYGGGSSVTYITASGKEIAGN